jgi:hypothetical protein
MSVTHPTAGLTPAHPSDFAARHPQLAPMLVALGIFAVAALAVLAVSGLPA